MDAVCLVGAPEDVTARQLRLAVQDIERPYCLVALDDVEPGPERVEHAEHVLETVGLPAIYRLASLSLIRPVHLTAPDNRLEALEDLGAAIRTPLGDGHLDGVIAGVARVLGETGAALSIEETASPCDPLGGVGALEGRNVIFASRGGELRSLQSAEPRRKLFEDASHVTPTRRPPAVERLAILDEDWSADPSDADRFLEPQKHFRYALRARLIDLRRGLRRATPLWPARSRPPLAVEEARGPGELAAPFRFRLGGSPVLHTRDIDRPLLLEPLPRGEPALQWVPPLDARLADAPAEIDLTPVDQATKVDETHGEVLHLRPELLHLRHRRRDPLLHLRERLPFLLELLHLAQMAVALQTPLDRVDLILQVSEHEGPALDLLQQRSDLRKEALGLLASKVARHTPGDTTEGGSMPLYVLLTKVTSQGIKTIRDNPQRIKDVNREVEQMGARLLAQYATLGRYDFVNIIEAKDDATVAKVSVNLGARGTLQIETLTALPIDDFIKSLKPARRSK